ncbi:hypothetical protein SDC9_51725 [bioreactor metagenome]|uniref:Uncharacterized protein n=1 Tax=bioreactor metagenome TaxID=1076179 RepID=A0A644WNF5_9ZZZZ
MKAILIFTAAVCSFFISSAQSACSFAQMQKISELKRINGELKTILFETNDEKHVLLLDKHNEIILQKISDSGVEIEKEFTIVSANEETFLLDAFAGSEQIYVLSGYLKNKQLIVCKTIIDMENLEIAGKTTQLYSFPCKSDFYCSKDFKMISSPDNKFHLMLFIDEMTNNDSAYIDLKMYNSEMELQWEESMTKVTYEFFLNEEFIVDNFGNLHTILKERFNSLSISGIEENNYFITSYFADGQISGPIQINLPKGNIYDYKFYTPENGIVRFGGLYYNGTIVQKGLNEYLFRNGVYGIEINMLTKEISNTSQVEFDRQFLNNHNLENFVGQKIPGDGLLYIKTKNIVDRPDGGFFVVTEISISYDEGAQFTDIDVFSFNKSLDIEWMKNIRKDQRTEGGGNTTAYWKRMGSFFPFYTNNNLYIIYNDNINNLSLPEFSNSVSKYKTKANADNFVCIAEISESGEIHKCILDQNISAKGLPLITKAQVMKDNKSLYVTVRYSIAETHALITFE